MKILSVGYYDDYARFFLSIKNQFKEDSSIEFKYINIYLSGFIYWLVKELEFTTLIAYKAWFKVLFNKKEYQKKIINDSYKDINLNNIINFDKTLNNLSNKNIILLKLQACAYIDIIENIFIKYNPDILLLSDDSRLVIEIIDSIAKKYNTKIYYFEQGPFSTTILDTKGVNANASIRDVVLENNYTDFDEKLENIYDFFNRKKESKYKRNPIYRGIDYIYEYIFKYTPFVPIDLRRNPNIQNNTTIYNRLKQSKKLDTNIFKKDNNILLVLQVPFDVNLVCHSPLFDSHFDIVDTVYNALPIGYNLVVREHPLYKAKYEKELYKIIEDNPNIYLDIDSNLKDTIEKSSIVIVNNSTVGIESIAKFKNTIVLGNSYYDKDEICFKLKDKKKLNDLILKALNTHLDKMLIVDYLDKLCFEFLIDGHFRDERLIAPKEIVKIIKDLKNDI
jgi:capsular polysaccharide export protein